LILLLGASFPVIDSFKGLNVAALIVLGRIHQYAVKSPYNYKEKDISKIIIKKRIYPKKE